jgi:hypothetical protein
MAIVFALPGLGFLEAGWRLSHDYESGLLYDERRERANHRYIAGGLWLFGVFALWIITAISWSLTGSVL